MKRLGAMVAGLALGFAGAVSAEPLDGRTARAMLYDPSGVQVTLFNLDFLSDEQRVALEFAAKQQAYYAAIAVAPSEGLLSEATIAAANFHDVGSARIAALRGCDAKRQGGAPCIIAAEIRPLGWEPRPLSLSVDATVGLRQKYLRGTGQKAMAISRSTGIWSVGKGAGAAEQALDGCALKASAADCELAVEDR